MQQSGHTYFLKSHIYENKLWGWLYAIFFSSKHTRTWINLTKVRTNIHRALKMKNHETINKIKIKYSSSLRNIFLHFTNTFYRKILFIKGIFNKHVDRDTVYIVGKILIFFFLNLRLMKSQQFQNDFKRMW